MKWLAGLQVVLATMFVYISGMLPIDDVPFYDYRGLTLPPPNPNLFRETVLIALAVIIFILAFWQFLKKTRFSVLQLIPSACMIILGVVLYLEASRSSYPYSPPTQWLVIASIAAAFMIIVTGVGQLFSLKTPSSPA
jgi:phosphatidylserine synthase